MTDPVKRYKRALKRDLRCFGSTRETLLQKFELSLSDFLEDVPSPDLDELYAAFGPPKEMADLLMAEIPPDGSARYHRGIIHLRIIAGILASIFLAGAVYIYFFKEQTVAYDNEIVVEDEHPSPTTE